MKMYRCTNCGVVRATERDAAGMPCGGALVWSGGMPPNQTHSVGPCWGTLEALQIPTPPTVPA